MLGTIPDCVLLVLYFLSVFMRTSLTFIFFFKISVPGLLLTYYKGQLGNLILFFSIERINSKKKSLSKRPPAPGKPRLKPKPAPSLPRCKTLWPYDATDVEELSFQPDEIIEIIKEGKITQETVITPHVISR